MALGINFLTGLLESVLYDSLQEVMDRKKLRRLERVLVKNKIPKFLQRYRREAFYDALLQYIADTKLLPFLTRICFDKRAEGFQTRRVFSQLHAAKFVEENWAHRPRQAELEEIFAELYRIFDTTLNDYAFNESERIRSNLAVDDREVLRESIGGRQEAAVNGRESVREYGTERQEAVVGPAGPMAEAPAPADLADAGSSLPGGPETAGPMQDGGADGARWGESVAPEPRRGRTKKQPKAPKLDAGGRQIRYRTLLRRTPVKLSVLAAALLLCVGLFSLLWQGGAISAKPSYRYRADRLTNTAVITAYEGRGKHVVVPGEIDGYQVVGIGGMVFQNRDKIISIELPPTVREFGYNTFGGCSGLERINLPDGVQELPERLFDGCASLGSILIPDSVELVGDRAFRNCASLEAVVIPEGVTALGQGLFADCGSLRTVTLPRSLKTIGEDAFRDCAALAGVALYDGLEEIGASAFRGCAALGEVVVPDSVAVVGEYAFAESGVTRVVLPDALEIVSRQLFYECGLLEEVNIPAGAASIEYCAFYACVNLRSVHIPSAVTAVEERAFYGCVRMESLTIDPGLERIGEDAFARCDSLVAVALPETLRRLDISAFRSSDRLTGVYFAGDAPEITHYGEAMKPGAEHNNYSEYTVFTVYYPAGRSGWSESWYGFETVPC